MRPFRQHPTKRVAEKRSTPEFKPLSLRRIATNVAGFKAHPIHHGHVNAVRDRVTALDGSPGIVLGDSELGLLRGMPADGGRIKKNGCALQGRQPRAFRIPLVPTNKRAQATGAGVERAKTKVSRSEIKLFIVERIVGNVHLAVEAAERTVTVEDRGRVVVNAGGPLLKQRGDQHHSVVSRCRSQSLTGRTGNRFGQIEQRMILALTEILSLKKFRQADHLRTASGSVSHAADRLL